MNIWNKVLLSFILLISLAFVYLAVKDLKLHRKWGDQAKTYISSEEGLGSIEIELNAQYEAINGTLVDGEVVEPGIRQLSVDVNKLMLERGRAWFNCQPTSIGQTGIRVGTSLPDPHGVSAKSVVYVFEQKSAKQGGNYLGQFFVVAVAPREVQLQPSRQLSAPEMQRVKDSVAAKSGWALFETLPVDDPDAFQGLTPEQIAILPEHIVAEYIDKAQEHKLLDYEIYFDEAHRLRSQNADRFAALSRDNQYLNEANQDAKVQDQARRQEIDDLKVEFARVHREAEAVTVHRDNLQAKVKAIRTAILETVQENSDLAGRIAKAQLEAARKIDQPQPPRVAQIVGR